MEDDEETIIKRQNEEELKQKRLDNLRKARDARKKKVTTLTPSPAHKVEVYENAKEGNSPFKFAIISLLGIAVMALFSGNRKANEDAYVPSSLEKSKSSKDKESEVVHEKETSFFNNIETMGMSW